jgi:hypothetical protein
MPGERMQLTALIRMSDLAQDSMIVRSWYIRKASARAVHEDWFRRLRTSRFSGCRTISLATGDTRTHAR